MHILTESALRAWAHTRTPQARAISIAAATSASVITARSVRLSVGPAWPDTLSLKRSVPSRTSSRQILRTSSGPSATHAKVGVSMCGKCSSFSSPSPPVTVISGPLAR
jgi:hypothetical protein